MKIVKIILGIIVILIAIPLIAGLFIDKEYHVSREIVINQPKEKVFDYVKYLKNQDHYSKWASMDPNMVSEYRGEDGTVGFVSAWSSEDKEVGKGEQEIVKISEGDRIDYELRFIEPFESTSSAYMATEASGDSQTKVVWAFHGKMKYPMNLMLVIMDMDKAIGEDLETGLKNLKEILE